MTFVETLRCSKDPLSTLSLYEQRLSRRFLQTLSKLHQMQKERRALEQEQLKQLYMISLHHLDPETLEPAEFGFVCSSAGMEDVLQANPAADTAAEVPER
jgi:hypothetical protein